MLRNLGIRSKILATLSIPVLLLFVVAGVLIRDANHKREVAKSYQNALDANGSFTQLIAAVQAERSLSLAVLSGDVTQQAALKQVRSGISTGLNGLKNSDSASEGVDSGVNTEAVQQIWKQLQQFNQNLVTIRKQVDTRTTTADKVNESYSQAVGSILRIPDAMRQSFPVTSMQHALGTVSADEYAIEAVMQERDALMPVVTEGGYSSATSQQAGRLAISRRIVTGETADNTATNLGGEIKNSSQLSKVENTLMNTPVGQDPGVSAAQLTSATQAQSNALRANEKNQLSAAKSDISQTIDDATRRMIWTALGSALVLATMILLALYMSRTIAAPLRRLTRAVDRVHAHLPELVNHDNPDHKVALTEDMIVPVESDDEVGRLANSFNDVNRAMVDTANSQAELRSSISGMFVNVARRDQSLLSRQLGLIDQLERTEEDPQTLSTLFKLDHLSTRMRRNAEALLVLAGIDTGRRLRRPMALSDVIRTASSEIEHYDRVDLVQTVDPQMLGHTALSAASLLAELLENATSFSDPSSRVAVRTENSPGGVAVIITDEGLGMSQAEVNEANTKITSLSMAEVVASKRIGFFVVGRLARRLESSVVVSRGETRGTVVRVEFPPQVFVPSAVTHVQGPTADGEAPSASPAAEDVSSLTGRPTTGAGASPVPASGAAAGAAGAIAGAGAAAATAGPRVPRAGISRRPTVPADGPTAKAEPTPAADRPQGQDTETPESSERGERPAHGGGLFSNFRRTQAPDRAASTPAAAPEPPNASAAADPAPSAAPSPTAPVTPPAAPSPPAAAADRPAQPLARRTPKTPGSGQARPDAATRPAPTGAEELARRQPQIAAAEAAAQSATPPAAAQATARDILPGSGRKPATGRGTTRPARPEAAGAAEAQPERGGSAAGSSTPPVRRTPEDAPVQSAPIVTGAASSGFAAEALSELSRLQAYRPATMATSESGSATPSTLVRRQAGATPAGQLPPPKPQPSAPRRSRSAADVRSMLSGFQAGVERGRTTGSDSPAEPEGRGPTT